MRKIIPALQKYMKPGITLAGMVDCVEPEDVIGWLYPTATGFQPCGANCKKCSSGTQCEVCGDIDNPGQLFFLDQSSGSFSCTPTTCLLSDFRYQVVSPHCLQCSATTYYLEGSDPPRCDECLQSSGNYLEILTRICKRCPSHCGECLSPTQCVLCKDPTKWLLVDKITCAEKCGERQMEVTDGQKKTCENCSTHCQTCDMINKCTKCNDGYYIESGMCVKCSNGCLTCSSATECMSCQNPLHLVQTDKSCREGCKDREFKAMNQKKCIQCSDNCLECLVDGCIKCQPNMALVKKECKETNLVDYTLQQFYDPHSKWTFNLNIILTDQEGLPNTVYNEFNKSMVNRQGVFDVARKGFNENLSYKIEGSEKKNQFKIRIDLPQSEDISIGLKFDLVVKSNSHSLDPDFVDKTRYHNLKEKTQEYEIKVLKTGIISPSQTVQSASDITATLNPASSTIGTTFGSTLMIFSHDPEGEFLKFTQYLRFLKRVKLIGEFFGVSLETLIESLSPDEKNKKYDQNRKNIGRRRGLEISLKHDQKYQVE